MVKLGSAYASAGVLQAFTIMVCLLLSAPFSWAQGQVTVRLSSPSIAMNESATLTVSVSGVTDAVDVPIPETLDGGLQFTPTGRRYSMTSVNGQSSSALELDFIVTPLRTGRHLIEPITGTVAGIPFTTESQRLEVTDVGTGGNWSSGGASQPGSVNPWSGSPSSPGLWPSQPILPEPREDDVILEAGLEPQTVYKHQPTFYNLRLATAVRLMSDPRYNPIAPTGFLRVQFEQENGSEDRQGRYYSVSSVKTAYFPLSEGEYKFDSTEVQVSPGMFALPRVLRTEGQSLTVLPLPTEGRPQSFTGAVGQRFEIRAYLKDPQIALGGNSQLEVTVKGDGHLNLVPYPYLPKWAQLDQKQGSSPSTTAVENGEIVSRRTYNFRIKPLKEGTYELSGIALGYFNPVEKRYEVIKAPSLSLRVNPNGNAADALPSQASGGEVSESDRPRESPGTTQGGRLPELPLAALISGVMLMLVGALLALPGRPRAWWRVRGRAKGTRGHRSRHGSAKELLASLESVAPGPDTASRQRHLQAQGWSAQAISRLESLRLRATRAVFGGTANFDDAALESLDKELNALLKDPME